MRLRSGVIVFVALAVFGCSDSDEPSNNANNRPADAGQDTGRDLGMADASPDLPVNDAAPDLTDGPILDVVIGPQGLEAFDPIYNVGVVAPPDVATEVIRVEVWLADAPTNPMVPADFSGQLTAGVAVYVTADRAIPEGLELHLPVPTNPVDGEHLPILTLQAGQWTLAAPSAGRASVNRVVAPLALYDGVAGASIPQSLERCVGPYGVGCEDDDGDGVLFAHDNCAAVANADQEDADQDTVGDVCDPCAEFTDNTDTNGDGVGDACDPCLDAGAPVDCDDGNPCNGVETCDSVLGCIALSGTACDDGNPCNGMETCDESLGCRPGTALTCNDGNDCTDDTCDPMGGCVFTENASCGLNVLVTPGAGGAGSAATTSLSVNAPAASVLMDTMVTARPSTDLMSLPAVDVDLAASSHQFQPDAFTFERPIQVALPITPAMVPDGVQVVGGETAPVQQFDPVNQRWEAARRTDGSYINARVSLDGTHVLFTTDHFTDYAFGQACIPSCASGQVWCENDSACASGEVCVLSPKHPDFCTRPCTSDSDCNGRTCSLDTDGDGLVDTCEFGRVCQTNRDCFLREQCTQWDTPQGFCSNACTDDTDCAPGLTCSEDTNLDGTPDACSVPQKVCGSDGCGGDCGVCNSDDPCVAAICVEENGPVHCEYHLVDNCQTQQACTSNRDCFDDNPCTTEVCDAGFCSKSFMSDGTVCSTFGACEFEGTCNFGECVQDPASTRTKCDSDFDGSWDETDNCPTIPNRRQSDIDQDGIGDTCDPDRDGDGHADAADNCVWQYNPNQADQDANGIGDACEEHLRVLDTSTLHAPIFFVQGVARLGETIFASGRPKLNTMFGVLHAYRPGIGWQFVEGKDSSYFVYSNESQTRAYGLTQSYQSPFEGKTLRQLNEDGTTIPLNFPERNKLNAAAVTVSTVDDDLYLHLRLTDSEEIWRYDQVTWSQSATIDLKQGHTNSSQTSVRRGVMTEYRSAERTVDQIDLTSSNPEWVSFALPQDLTGQIYQTSPGLTGPLVFGGSLKLNGTDVGCGIAMGSDGNWAAMGGPSATYNGVTHVGDETRTIGTRYNPSRGFLAVWDGQSCTGGQEDASILGGGRVLVAEDNGVIVGVGTAELPPFSLQWIGPGGVKSVGGNVPPDIFTPFFYTLTTFRNEIFAQSRRFGADGTLIRVGEGWSSVPQERVLVSEGPIGTTDFAFATDMGVFVQNKRLRNASTDEAVGYAAYGPFGNSFITAVGGVSAFPHANTQLKPSLQLGWPTNTDGSVGYVSKMGYAQGIGLIVAGVFDEIDGIPAKNLAVLGDNGWREFGGGLTGSVTQIHTTASGKVCLVGSFTAIGQTAVERTACLEGQQWTQQGSASHSYNLTTRGDDLILVNRNTQTLQINDGAEIPMGRSPYSTTVNGPQILVGSFAAKGLFVYTEAPYWPPDEDADGDGVLNSQELAAGTNPHSWWSDSDKLSDGEELIMGSDPTKDDTDGDGLLDHEDACPTVVSQSTEEGVAACNDGVDNDCDGQADWWDRDCIGLTCTIPGDPANLCVVLSGTINGMGGCLGSGPRNCNDVNGCTIDSCEPAVGCVYDAIVCDDGNECSANGCISIPDPGDTTGLHPMSQCVTDLVTPNGQNCTDDGNPCTSDTCFAGTCNHDPDFAADGNTCDDGQFCTKAECSSGTCVQIGIEGCDDGDACTVDTCDPTSGCNFEACPTADGYVCGGANPPGCLSQVRDTVLVPGGPFIMGCNPDLVPFCQPETAPEHHIILSPYEVDRFEVTVGEYDACVQAGSCSFSLVGPIANCPNDVVGAPNLPATCVPNAAAQEFCDWSGMRLCTEAEWEKAARGTDGRRWSTADPAKWVRFYVSSSTDGDHIIFINGTPHTFTASGSTTADVASGLGAALMTHPLIDTEVIGSTIHVRSKVGGVSWTYDSVVPGSTRPITVSDQFAVTCDQANLRDCGGLLLPGGSTADAISPYGAYDMVGNVGEWVADYYDPAVYTTAARNYALDPAGPTAGAQWGIRGGNWTTLSDTWSRASASSAPAHTGFRCCVDALGSYDDRDSVMTDGPLIEPAVFDSVADDGGVDVFDFVLQDRGDSDGLDTQISGFTIQQLGTMQLEQHTFFLNGPDANNVAGTVVGTEIVFSGLNIVIADGGVAETYVISVDFKDSPAELNDNTSIQLALDTQDMLIYGTSFEPTTVGASAVYQVVATRMNHTSIRPTPNESRNQPFQFIVVFVDQDGERDTDVNGDSINVTRDDGGSITVTSNFGASNGVCGPTVMLGNPANAAQRLVVTDDAGGSVDLSLSPYVTAPFNLQ